MLNKKELKEMENELIFDLISSVSPYGLIDNQIKKYPHLFDEASQIITEAWLEKMREDIFNEFEKYGDIKKEKIKL